MQTIHNENFSQKLKTELEALNSKNFLSNEAAEAIYTLAYQDLKQKQYDTALNYLSLLTLHHPTNTDYLHALALCYRLREQYEEAINVYSFIIAIEEQHIEYDLAVAECLALQGKHEEAIEQTKLILQSCEENASPPKIIQRVQALLYLLDSTQAASSN